jgi:DNA-directed RNA polymerase specialized sigma24 family protein
MDESTFEQPPPEDLAAFVHGDPVAIDRVMRLVIPQLHRWAVRRYGNLAPDEVKSVLHQVLAEVCRRHARYDPCGARFTTYVIGLLRRRMADLHEAQTRIRAAEDSSPEAHEKLRGRPYNQSSESEIASRLNRTEFLEAVRERLGDVEQEFLELMLQGEKTTDAFAAILRCHGPVSDAPRKVKNTKERLLRKMHAVARERGYTLEDLLDW